MPNLALARALIVAAGRAATRRAAALYLTIGLVAALLFPGPNGMRASDLTNLSDNMPAFRVALALGWLLLAAPVVDALLVVPSTFALRALPIAAWRQYLVHGALALLAELPWFLLWWRGAGWLAGVGAALSTLGLHALWVARPRRAHEALIAIAALCSIVLAAPPPIAVVIGSLATLLGVPLAWQRAPERSATQRRRLVGGSALVALALAGILRIVRCESSLLVRGLVAVLALAAMAALVISNNHVTAPASIVAVSLALAVPSLGIACASIAAPIVRSELLSRWLLDATGAGGLVRVASSALAVSSWSLPCALAHASLVATIVAAPPALTARLLVTAALLGILVSIYAVVAARGAERGDADSGERLFVALLAFTIALAILLGVYGERAFLIAVPVVATLAIRQSRTAAITPRLGRRDEPTDARSHA